MSSCLDDLRVHLLRVIVMVVVPSALASAPEEGQPAAISFSTTMELKRRLLDMFNVKREPFALKNEPLPKVPKFMHDVYEDFVKRAQNSAVDEEIRCFFNKDRTRSMRNYPQQLSFRIESNKHYDDFKLLHATLHLFAVYNPNSTDPAHHHPGRNVTIKVYARNSQTERLELINSTIVNLEKKRPILRVGVRKAVNKWRRGPENKGWKNAGFEIIVSTPHGHLAPPLRIAKRSDGDFADIESQLVTYMKLKNLSARRRRERKQRQTLEVVAAWDTLNKATQEWEALYSPEIINITYPKVLLPGRPSFTLPTQAAEEKRNEEEHMALPIFERRKRAATSDLNLVDQKAVRRAERKWVSNECRKYKLWVSFQTLGWDWWIIAPSGFYADFCAGQCRWPITEHLNPSTHAVIQSLMHKKFPHLAPKAACVPTKFRQLQMLYIDEDDTIVLNDSYGDMQAVQCGCQ